MMGIENVYGALLNGLQSENQKLLLTKLKKDGTLEKHIYEPGTENESVEALAQQAAFEKKVCITGFDDEQKTEKWIAEPFCKENRMLIFGGGHVSLALAEFAARTGFAVTVTDDRPSFANELRFPTAKQVLCMDFETAIEKLHVNSSDFVVLLTRGHRHDGVCPAGPGKAGGDCISRHDRFQKARPRAEGYTGGGRHQP